MLPTKSDLTFFCLTRKYRCTRMTIRSACLSVCLCVRMIISLLTSLKRKVGDVRSATINIHGSRGSLSVYEQTWENRSMSSVHKLTRDRKNKTEEEKKKKAEKKEKKTKSIWDFNLTNTKLAIGSEMNSNNHLESSGMTGSWPVVRRDKMHQR